MAYFVDDIEIEEILDEQCKNCLHADSDTTCPIWAVQTEFNLVQQGNKDLKKALNMLIDKDGTCNMKPLIDAIG